MITPKLVRAGRFNLTRAAVMNRTSDIADLFGFLRIVPYHIDVDVCRDEVRYCAFSPAFDEMTTFEIVPEYRLTVTVDDARKLVEAKAERVQSEETPHVRTRDR